MLGPLASRGGNCSMTLRKLASLIAFREGKKHEATISDIREILKILCTIEAEQSYLKASELPSLAIMAGSWDVRLTKKRKQELREIP